MADQLFTVIGGSGFLGRYIVQQLAKAGHRVRVAVREPEKALFLKPLGAVGQIMPIAASVLDENSIKRAMQGADGAVNLVGILFESGQQKFDAVQAEGAERCARLAAEADVKRFVHVSAIGADAGSDVGYARTKGEGENAVFEAFPDATILRPSIVFGPEDGFLNRFGDMAAKAPFMPLICGNTRFQPVYVGDVAEAVFKALTQAGFEGKTYELGGPRAYTFKEVLRFILDETMRKRPFIPIPTPVAKIQGAVLGMLPNPPLTLGQVKMLENDNVVSPDAQGLEAFDIEPTTMEAIAPSYLVRYRPRGRFSKKTQET